MFHLGCADDPAQGHERFKGWLAFPYLTPAGPVAMKFRCMEDHDHHAHGHGKYDGPAGQKIRLFNVPVLAAGGDVVVICEGEMDAITGTAVLGVPTCGTWGTNWFDHHSRCFGDFDRVLVVADNDVKEDGSNPGLKHAKKVQATISGAELAMPPPGHDLSSWVAEAGAEAVRGAMGL